MARELTHYIGGKAVAGTSGRFDDVFDPNTGGVQAKVPLATTAEVETAIADAKAAQPGGGANTPQRRARVLMKFLDLINREMEPLAKLLSSEHGKTVPDSKGDIQRWLEVLEFAIGIPHLLKGEFTEGAGTGIDVCSIRQPRKAFGKAIGAFQALQFRIADMATELEAARLLLWRAAMALDTGAADATLVCAMAKRFAPDGGFNVANEALQMHGGYGYLADYGIEKIVRDLRVHQILEGTNEIMRLIISRQVLAAK